MLNGSNVTSLSSRLTSRSNSCRKSYSHSVELTFTLLPYFTNNYFCPTMWLRLFTRIIVFDHVLICYKVEFYFS